MCILGGNVSSNVAIHRELEKFASRRHSANCRRKSSMDATERESRKEWKMRHDSILRSRASDQRYRNSCRTKFRWLERSDRFILGTGIRSESLIIETTITVDWKFIKISGNCCFVNDYAHNIPSGLLIIYFARNLDGMDIIVVVNLLYQ